MPFGVFNFYKQGVGNVSWIYKFIVISKENKVMVTSEDEEMMLPTFQPNMTHVAVTEHINDYFKVKFGLETNVLRCYRQLENLRIYEIELIRKSIDSAKSASWVHMSFINEIKTLNNEDHLILRDWLTSPKSTIFPWFTIGWRKSMENWVTGELMLMHDSFQIEQIRSWERSALFRFKSDTKNYYFKAVPYVFFHEPLISNYLYHHHPSYVPKMVGIEPEQGWYIMEELDGPLLGQSRVLDHWKDSLMRLATIQKHSILKRDTIIDLQCPLRPVSEIVQLYLKKSLNELVDSNFITSDTYRTLTQNIPELISKCKSLEKSKVPLALEHGDFFGGNIIIHCDQPIIYDWSDCTWSHPFLSTMVLLEEVKQIFSEEKAKVLLDLYLEEWMEFDSRPTLFEEYNLLVELSPAYYLSVYQTFIFPTFTDNWDQQQIIEHYIRKLLASLDK